MFPIVLLGCFAQAQATEAVDDLLREASDLDADAGRGRTLYAENCAGCHGRRGQGDAKRKIPVIAQQRQAYIVKQFADIREDEREAPPMHSVMSQPELRDVQAWVDVAIYVNNLAPVKKVQTGNGKHLALGEATFGQHCVSCHGEDARGDDDGFVPSLRNQHYSYLLDTMNRLTEWHRSNVDPELVRLLSSFSSDERMGMADYLARLQGKTRDLTWLRPNGAAGD
jgi:cytochrome c553